MFLSLPLPLPLNSWPTEPPPINKITKILKRAVSKRSNFLFFFYLFFRQCNNVVNHLTIKTRFSIARI